MSKIRIFIAIPSCRDWKPHFAVSLLKAVCFTQKDGLDGALEDITVAPTVNQSNLPAARQKLLDVALEGNFTHIFMVDDDMQFPPDTLARLLSPNQNVVCANACRKLPDQISGVCLDMEGQRIDSSDRDGLERVLYGTLAMTMIRLDPIRSLPAPHFEMIWRDELKDYIGEDHYFFRKMGLAGIDFYCDHDLSKQISHIGDYPYAFKTRQHD